MSFEVHIEQISIRVTSDPTTGDHPDAHCWAATASLTPLSAAAARSATGAIPLGPANSTDGQETS